MSKFKWLEGLWSNTTADSTNNITVSTCFPNTTGSTSDCSGFGGNTAVNGNTINITTDSTTAGSVTWITWPTTTWQPVLPIPSVEISKDETVEVYISPDQLCLNCSQPIGMFCEKGHYIKSDSEEYRFAHSLTCNEKLGLRFRAKEAQGIKSIEHIVCPPQEE